MTFCNDWLSTNISERVSNPNTDFEVKIKPYKFISKSFDQECDITAQTIAKKYNKIFIGLSGGYDSEFVCKIFLRNNIDFTPIISVYVGNEEERKYAFVFCEKYNLNPVVLELDKKQILDILYQDIFKKLNGVGVNSIGCIAAARYAENNNGAFIEAEHIIGDGKTNIRNFNYYLSEWDFYNYTLTNIPILSFFLYRLELTYSMLELINESYFDWATFKNIVFDCAYRNKIKPRYHNDVYTVINYGFKARKYFPKCQYFLGEKESALKCLTI